MKRGPMAPVTSREPVQVMRDRATGEVFVAPEGDASTRDGAERVGTLPPLYPEWLGDRSFAEAHGVRFPYVAGEMANGIATPRLVVAMARAGMLGFFGAAGLSVDRVERGLDEIVRNLEGRPAAWGANLIHSPTEPALEARVAKLYADRAVPCIEASAFMDLTPNIVRLACSRAPCRRRRSGRAAPPHPRQGLKTGGGAPLHVARAAGDASRPRRTARALRGRGSALATRAAREATSRWKPIPAVTRTTARWACSSRGCSRCATRWPPRSDSRIQAPSVSARRAASALPSATAAAFALGAAYVMTGSVNQSAVESGLSEDGRRMLAQADLADVAMAAAADMFELGVKLQVLKRGTLFAVRANRLYEVYRANLGLDTLDTPTRLEVEKIFGRSIDDVNRETETFWRARDEGQLDRALSDPKHRMALVLRWYLGQSSRWAIAGETSRRGDYQIWCGPAMGAFNAWVRGSFLEDPANRSVVQIGRNLLEGAAVVTRAHQLRTYGVSIPHDAFTFHPRVLK